MADPALDRTLAYRLAEAYDCWGNRRSLRRGTQHGIWFIDATGIDESVSNGSPSEVLVDLTESRERGLAQLRSSGRFTPLELATLEALIVGRLTLAEIAARQRCSRQAVRARLVGNSRGQGGILKKARAWLNQQATGDM